MSLKIEIRLPSFRFKIKSNCCIWPSSELQSISLL